MQLLDYLWVASEMMYYFNTATETYYDFTTMISTKTPTGYSWGVVRMTCFHSFKATMITYDGVLVGSWGLPRFIQSPALTNLT